MIAKLLTLTLCASGGAALAQAGAPAAHAPAPALAPADDAPLRAISFAQALGAAANVPELAAQDAALRSWGAALHGAALGRPALALTAAPGLDDTGLAWQAEFTATLTPGRQHALRASARAQAQLMGAESQVRRGAQARHAARAWLATWAAQQRLALADEERGAATELARLARRARALAVGTAVEEAAAEAYQAELELAHLALEGELIEAQLALAEATGEPLGARLGAAGELPAPALAADEPAPPLALAAQAAHAAAEQARRRAAEATANARPQLVLGVRGEGSAAAHAGFAVLGVTFAGGERGLLAGAAQRAEATRLDGLAESLRRLAALEQGRLAHEEEHSAATQLAEEARAAALDRQVRALEAAHRAAEATLPELLLARRALWAARAGAVRARAEAVRARVERALVAGREATP